MNGTIILTVDEIAQYRSQLADDPHAQRALDMLEDCEGDLEDAAISLALQSGQEPDRSDRWLDGLAKRWRAFACQPEMRELLALGSIGTAIRTLGSQTDIPAALATPVILYILKVGAEDFCKPMQEKL